MKVKQIQDGEVARYVVVFEPGEEAVDGIEAFAAERGLTAAQFTAIGAFRRATLGFFDLEQRDYERIPVGEQSEVVMLVGNISEFEEKPKVHPHAVLSRRDGSCLGGHLLEGVVDPTLEVIVTEAPAMLRRRVDERTGLPLLHLPDG